MFVVFCTVILYIFVFMTCCTSCCPYDTLMNPWNGSMNPWRFTIFSTGVVSCSTNLNMYPGFLCHVYGQISLNSWFFLWFLKCGLVQVLLLNLVL